MTIVKTTEFDTHGQPMEYDSYYCDHCKELIDHNHRHIMDDVDFLYTWQPKNYDWPFGKEYHWRCWSQIFWQWKKDNPKWRLLWKKQRVSIRQFEKIKRLGIRGVAAFARVHAKLKKQDD